MEYLDYYKLLGVAREATQDDIKRAYRKLARKYHPDVSKEPDAEARFKEVGEAYEVLKDVEKRAAYDQLGADWQNGQNFQPPPDWDAGFEFSGGGYTTGDAEFHSDFFEEMFGRNFHRQSGGPSGYRPTQGEDHHAKVLIDLEDSINGASRSISLRVPELSDDGHVQLRDRTLNVRIPKGIRPGQQLRLAGQGGPGPGGSKAGDLYLEVEFRQHPLYRLDGADVHLDLPVTPWEAVLGASINVPTLSGTVNLKIPPGSGQGKKLRIKDRGLPGKTPGHMYVELQIALPPADTEAAKKLYGEMEEQLEFNPRQTMGVS
jgi:curved DNA-binding protein